MLSSIDLNGGGFIFGCLHPAGRKPFPDQLIKPQLVSGKGFLDLYRDPADIRRPDRLMGVLDFLSGFFRSDPARRIFLAVGLYNVFLRHSLSFLGNPDGICTEIGDQTYRAASLDLHSFIKLLCKTHGLLRGKIQHLACFLLQGRGCKRKRSLFGPFSLFDLCYLVFFLLKL